METLQILECNKIRLCMWKLESKNTLKPNKIQSPVFNQTDAKHNVTAHREATKYIINVNKNIMLWNIIKLFDQIKVLIKENTSITMFVWNVMWYACTILENLLCRAYRVPKLNEFHARRDVRAYTNSKILFYNYEELSYYLNRNYSPVYVSHFVSAQWNRVVPNYCDNVWINLPVNYNWVKRLNVVLRHVDLTCRELSTSSYVNSSQRARICIEHVAPCLHAVNNLVLFLDQLVIRFSRRQEDA